MVRLDEDHGTPVDTQPLGHEAVVQCVECRRPSHAVCRERRQPPVHWQPEDSVASLGDPTIAVQPFGFEPSGPAVDLVICRMHWRTTSLVAVPSTAIE